MVHGNKNLQVIAKKAVLVLAMAKYQLQGIKSRLKAVGALPNNQ